MMCQFSYGFFLDDIVIQYDESKVVSHVFYKPSGKQIPHVTLFDLVSPDEKEKLNSFDANLSNWKWYMGVQSLIAGFAGYAYIQHYIDDDLAYEVRHLPMVQAIMNKYKSHPAYRWLAGLGISLATLYPFYRFWNLFLAYLEDEYPITLIDDTIFVIQRKTFSHAETSGNMIIHYFNYSEPIGYMLVSEKEQFFKQVYQARKVSNLTMMVQASIGFFGGWWFLSESRAAFRGAS